MEHISRSWGVEWALRSPDQREAGSSTWKIYRPPDPGLPSPCPGSQVYRQELLKQHQKELQEWKDEKVRQEVEFTITDRKVKVRRAEGALNTKDLSDWPYWIGHGW